MTPPLPLATMNHDEDTNYLLECGTQQPASIRPLAPATSQHHPPATSFEGVELMNNTAPSDTNEPTKATACCAVKLLELNTQLPSILATHATAPVTPPLDDADPPFPCDRALSLVDVPTWTIPNHNVPAREIS